MGRIIDRRRVMGGKEATYIQDGLVFWLDGIDKGNDPTAWTELINGVSFPYNNGQEIRSDSVYFNGNAGLISSSSSLNHPLENCQIEVIIDNNNNSNVIITPNKYDNIAFGFYQDMILGCTSPKIYSGLRLIFRSVFPKQKTSYSMNINYLIYNNAVLNPVSVPQGWDVGIPNVYEIGQKNNAFKYIGNIYSIRIYNRHLTDEERTHNYNIDKQRFGID